MSEASDRIAQYLEAGREEVIAAAEAKLGRSLSPEEEQGIRDIKGGMMLESCCQAFSHIATTPEEVAKELAFFAGPHSAEE